MSCCIYNKPTAMVHVSFVVGAPSIMNSTLFLSWQFCMNMFLKSAITDLLVHVYIRIEKSNVISVPFDDNFKLHKNHTVWHIYRFIPFHIDQDETI